MCGIAGFVTEHETGPVAERTAVLDRMCRILTHRGPDDQGIVVEGPVALAMRRLSIIDLVGGHQPISGEDGTVTIVFNGEIYNFRDLQRQLETRGHTFRTRSDTEAIVHLYEEYGASCVDHLNGMFAFAIWDARNRKLFIGRDRTGEKPLYYTVTPTGAFVFGSEIKALLEHPHVEREINLEALDAYFTLGYVPDPLSIFRNIHKLPAGHHLTFADGRVSVRQYWDFTFEPAPSRREEDYLEELRTLLDEAVRMRLISDVPLGAFLSGGIDSSTVVGLMARHMDQPVKTFSIGFHEDSYDELKYARLTARNFGTDHHEFIVTPDICNIVDELAWHFDEPFADQAAIPNYVVSKLAREHVKVVLSGDGGDELFAGYTRYVTQSKRSRFSRVPQFFRKGLMQPISRKLPHSVLGRNYFHNISLDSFDRYIDSVSIFTRLNKLSLYTRDFQQQLKNHNETESLFQELESKVKTTDALDALLYIDCKTYLPGAILTKVDRMSMAVSLEARVPFLDHKLIEFVTTIPASLKMKNFETKHILKRAVRNLIPNEIVNRAKQGFGVPIQEWINRELKQRIRETLSEQRSRERGYVEQRYVNLLLDEHERGRRDHSTALWSLFMLELWHRRFLDDARVEINTPKGAEDLSPSIV